MRYAVRPPAAVTPIEVPQALLSGRPETPERRAAYGLLAELMADVEAGTGSVMRLQKDGLGRPIDPDRADLWVSVAHTAGAVAAAVSLSGPVGIDVEASASYDPEVADLVLTDAQRRAVETSPDPDAAFLRFWVRKEALGKALGVGIDDPVLAAAVEQDNLTVGGLVLRLQDVKSPVGTRAALAVGNG